LNVRAIVLSEGPGNVFPHHKGRIFPPLFERRKDIFRRRRITQGYRQVTQPALVADAVMGLPAIRSLKSVSDQQNNSASRAPSSPCRGAKSGSTALRANRFHGHASWQSSQPYIRLPIIGRNASGIDSFNSMVRYEMQRRASTR
jgi:hypothetical protein